MPIDELTEALQGFSGAYTKVGAFLNFPDINLRVSTPQRGSYEIPILALFFQHRAQFQTVGQAWDWAKRIFNIVKGVADLKKQTKGLPYKIDISGSNNVVNIITADQLTVPITREILEVYENRIIDS
jgi:hypothetical protein